MSDTTWADAPQQSLHGDFLPELDRNDSLDAGAAANGAFSLGDEFMDFPYGFWDQGGHPWSHELDLFTVEVEPLNQPLADDPAIERAKPYILDHLRRRSGTSSPTTRSADMSWYSSPPQLQVYDKEVLNVLLNVARRHLGTTFELYADYEAQADSEPELCLAMAAVGALYLGAECGATMSQALYNDARRLHFHKFHSGSLQTSFREASASLKTFILLSIYGICSGDKRSYEFVEAFQVSMLQASRYYGRLVPSDPDAATLREVRSMCDAMELIECYHVLILHRPPCPIPASLKSMTPSGQAQTALGRTVTSHHLQSLDEDAHAGIASLSAIAWAASSQGEELSYSRQLWRSEFVELAMERWMSGILSPDFPSMLIYHLMHLHLKVSLDNLQKSARHFTKPPSRTADESTDHGKLENHVRGRLFAVAVWHAQAMLNMVQENVVMSDGSSNRTATSNTPHRLSEPPQLPYCIYFSSLILWYGEYASSGYRSLARDACIKRGIRLLVCLKIRVARVLILALRELLPDD